MENRSYQSNIEDSNPTELRHYRLISILPILSKMYEKQVLHKITDFIETQQVYNKHQSG